MQTPQTLLILLAQVSTTENLLNQIWQIVYLFNWEKKQLEKVYNNLLKSLSEKAQYS